MVPLRTDSVEDTTSTWSGQRSRPRLVLHDFSDAPAAPQAPRTVPTHRRKSARRWEGLALSLTVAVVLGFFLVSFLSSAWQAGVARSASAFAPTAPVISLRVERGDTLWQYAARYGDPNAYILDRVQTIARDNRLSPATPLAPGQTIRITVHNPLEIAKLQRQDQARVASR
ncbi:MAG: LysM peptidoglycan-binding domain-containing protein [Armatimonadota bacterium]|nr:LysM peptidoglycan-binding domain-containing protein [Armatimonadota bacterium]